MIRYMANKGVPVIRGALPFCKQFLINLFAPL
jgi:hypothetical protein